VGRAVKGNRALNSGDDGVSNNSYVGDPGIVHDITVEGNTILNNAWGRGLEVSGGSSITFTGNYVGNTDGYADVYFSSEYQWNAQSVANMIVSGNTLVV
jgi:parallel beta-helix repeat protein